MPRLPALRKRASPVLQRSGHAAAAAALALFALLGAAGPARADAYGDVQKLYRSGQAEQALAQADAYIREHPGDPQMRFVKANLLSSEGQTEQAQALLTELTQEYPELAEPWNNLAVLYADSGRLKAAEEALESALRINPGYATALENMGDVRLRLAQQAYEQARKSGNTSSRVSHKIEVLRELMQDNTNKSSD